MPKFSVLLSLYWKEGPEFLRQSLDSVFGQTLRADEVVLVEDGPLTPELDAVVKDYSARYPELKVVPLQMNVGLGRALNEGLKYCTNELVARMDTDDVAKPDRFEIQVPFMESRPEVAVSGSWIDEFIGSTDNVVSRRATAESPAEIREFAKSRNPLNHPSVIFRKRAVEAVGSYQHFPLFEDWYLWVRLLNKGYKLANIPEALLWFRTSADVYKRRGGWRYAMDSARFQFTLRRMGFISLPTAVKNSLMRGVVYVMPNSIRGWIYSGLLRK